MMMMCCPFSVLLAGLVDDIHGEEAGDKSRSGDLYTGKESRAEKGPVDFSFLMLLLMTITPIGRKPGSPASLIIVLPGLAHFAKPWKKKTADVSQQIAKNAPIGAFFWKCGVMGGGGKGLSLQSEMFTGIEDVYYDTTRERKKIGKG